MIGRKDGVNVAYGVEFDHHGKTWTVRAKKEVIISNGAIRTPQLLMLSGIGPKEHLKKFNVTWIIFSFFILFIFLGLEINALQSFYFFYLPNYVVHNAKFVIIS